ncbi:DUF5988 family protein [Streptomyces atroolivaceus]|uniref:DUF5988 family protein n=1 Tax=Streptomyces atroolivaceus TaxID=66869 RepID=UPI00364F22A4
MTTVLLVGGPHAVVGVHEMSDDAVPERVVVAYYGRHEHYDNAGVEQVVAGRLLPVFRWTHSTAIAE